MQQSVWLVFSSPTAFTMPDSSFGGRIGPYRPWLDRAVFGVGLLGLLVAVHLIIQENRGFDRGCLGFTTSEAVEASFDCAAVTGSSAGMLMGIPNGVWGMVFFLAVVGFTLFAAVAHVGTQPLLKRLRTGLVGIGVVYAGYLSYLQASVLEAYCALCLIVSALVAVLAVLHGIELMAVGRYKGTTGSGELTGLASGLGVTLLLVGLNVTYFQSLEPVEPAAAAATAAVANACAFAGDAPTLNDPNAYVHPADPVVGPDDAAVTILEFFDPNCPHCKTSHEAMQDVKAAHGADLRVVYKPLVVVGQFSVPQIAALYVAEEEGLFEEMLAAQFEQQQRGGLSMGQLQQIGQTIGLDPDALAQRMQNEAYLERMRAAREEALEDVGISGVPAIFIDGYFVPGQARTADCLTRLVAERLSDA